jgi:hypothetical protein
MKNLKLLKDKFDKLNFEKRMLIFLFISLLIIILFDCVA